MIPSVRYGPWQPYPSRPGAHGLLVRFLTCSSCRAILARELPGHPDDPHPFGRPSSWAIHLRSEMIPLAEPSPRGLPRYGQQRALRLGRRPRPLVRHAPIVERLGRAIDMETGQPVVPEAEWQRQLRRRRPGGGGPLPRLQPAADGILPGDPPIWFNQDVRLPCEVYCFNCGRLHLLTGRGPEGAPPEVLEDTGPEEPDATMPETPTP